MRMLHRGCGGVIKEDRTLPPYYYDPNNPDNDVRGNPNFAIPAYWCAKCGTEIIGDAQIRFDPPQP